MGFKTPDLQFPNEMYYELFKNAKKVQWGEGTKWDVNTAWDEAKLSRNDLIHSIVNKYSKTNPDVPEAPSPESDKEDENHES